MFYVFLFFFFWLPLTTVTMLHALLSTLINAEGATCAVQQTGCGCLCGLWREAQGGLVYYQYSSSTNPQGSDRSMNSITAFRHVNRDMSAKSCST